MIPALFVTGGTGFVGRRVLDALVRAQASDVRLLVRDRARLPTDFALPASWQCIEGDLQATDHAWHETLRSALRGVHSVLHLASSTGKVSRATHQQIIVQGTARVLDASREAGVQRVLYVSSVAAGFPDRTHYHYAEAKRAAELLVSATSMDALVVRPTMVFGEGSAVQDGFTKLANLPLPIVFGDGSPLVQPVHVRDLAALLVTALRHEAPWQGNTITVGGADTATTEALLRRLRRGANATTRFAHVPVDPLRALLALVEPVLLSLLPFTAGQLTSFVNRSDAGAPTPLLNELLAEVRAANATGAPWRGLDAMLASGGGSAH